ncbi:MAG: hypothetical protein LBQ27_02020, partial [Clostridiales bacterium]|nr:hypothetical protein [Clostridiales bacterium]
MKQPSVKLRLVSVFFVCVFCITGIASVLVGKAIDGLFGVKEDTVSAIDIGEWGEEGESAVSADNGYEYDIAYAPDSAADSPI